MSVLAQLDRGPRRGQLRDRRSDAAARPGHAGDRAAADVRRVAGRHDRGDLALRRRRARPGTGTRSGWASTPARTSTRRCTGSPARICPTTPATRFRPGGSSARRASSTSRPTFERNEDFLLTPERIEAWEAEHGRIPAGAWVLLRTGWSERTDPAAFLNVREDGPHTPGFHADASRLLARERDVLGVGVETVGTDAGQAGGLRSAVPESHDHARRGQVRPGEPAQSRSAAADRRGRDRRAAEDRERQRQPAAGAGAGAALTDAVSDAGGPKFGPPYRTRI